MSSTPSLLRIGVLAGAATLASCYPLVSTDREVYFDVPVSRLELPTVAPRAFASGGAAAGSARIELTHDQTTTPPDTKAPDISGVGTGQGRLDIQAGPVLMVSGRVLGDNLSALQIKLLALRPEGAERGSLAFTGAWGRGNVDYLFDASSYQKTTIHEHMRDCAMILGWRVGNHGLLYGGPYYGQYRYQGIFESSANPAATSFDSFAQAAGSNLGLAWTPVSWLQVVGEYSLARVGAGDSVRWIGRFAAQLEFLFGWRIPGSVPPKGSRPWVVRKQRTDVPDLSPAYTDLPS